jgi:hypothetical protein
MMMRSRSKTFWLIVVPLIAAAIHVALLCLAACIMMFYPKGVGSPPWAQNLFVILIWPYGLFYRCDMLGVWIGVGLSFLWMPAITFAAVRIFMGFRRKDTEPASPPYSEPAARPPQG